jgi:glycerol uptake facilitator-like aquaporin
VSAPNEKQEPRLRSQAAAEAAGTFALTFGGPASVALTATDASFGRLVLVAAVFAAIVAGSIVGVGRLSGSYINPAVTVAAAVRGSLPTRRAAAFVAAQLAGAGAAGLALLALFPPTSASAYLGSTALAPTVSAPVGTVLELVATFVLAFAALNAGRFAKSPPAVAAVVGGILFLLIVAFGPLTGASFNPARSLGPALASLHLDDLWVYVVGPLAGGALAGAASRLVATRTS